MNSPGWCTLRLGDKRVVDPKTFIGKDGEMVGHSLGTSLAVDMQVGRPVPRG